jgi:neutral ceramidase
MSNPARTTTRRELLARASAAVAGTMLLPAESLRAGQPKPFRAGAAVTTITPELGTELEGYFMKIGPVVAVHDDLHARCLALDDGHQRVAICVCDLCTPGSVFDRAKQIASRKTGLPADRMLMAATHTHAAPRIGVATGPKDLAYVQLLAERIAEAVGRAIDNLAPAKVGYGSRQVPKYTFNRRWWMKPGTIPPDPFGGTTDRVRFNPPCGSKNLVRPAGPVDPELFVLSVQHADGRPLAVLANYSIHYAGGYVRGDASADYYGVFAGRIGPLLGADKRFVGIMSNGTSGNIGAGTDFRKPPQRFGPWSRMKEIGEDLAGEALGIVKGIEHRGSLSLAMAEKVIQLGVRRPDRKRLEWAREILAHPETKHRHGWTPIYAREAILLSKYPASVPVKLQAVWIGGLGIAAIPCEVFAETGLAIKKASPLQPTFAMELANGYYGYLPTPEQHALGGYETWPARSSCLEVQAEPKIRRAVLELLGEVAGKV